MHNRPTAVALVLFALLFGATHHAKAQDDERWRDFCPSYPEAQITAEELEAEARAALPDVVTQEDLAEFLNRFAPTDAARELIGREVWVRIETWVQLGDRTRSFNYNDNGLPADTPYATRPVPFQYEFDEDGREAFSDATIPKEFVYHPNGHLRATLMDSWNLTCHDFAGEVTARYERNGDTFRWTGEQYRRDYDQNGNMIETYIQNARTNDVIHWRRFDELGRLQVSGMNNVDGTHDSENFVHGTNVYRYDGDSERLVSVNRYRNGEWRSRNTYSEHDPNDEIGRSVWEDTDGVGDTFVYTRNEDGLVVAIDVNGEPRTRNTWVRRAFSLPRLSQ